MIGKVMRTPMSTYSHSFSGTMFDITILHTLLLHANYSDITGRVECICMYVCSREMNDFPECDSVLNSLYVREYACM